MQPLLLVPIAGLLYTAAFTAMAALKREGVSPAFVIQALAVTAVFGVLNALGGSALHPLAFVLALYLFTMRVRIVLDLGSFVARAGRLAAAARIYDLAAALLPSALERSLLALNKAVCRLLAGDAAAAASALSGLLGSTEARALGVKHRSAAHYNLGVALNRQGRHAEAGVELQRVIDLWPVSEYARKAAATLRVVR